MKYTVSLGLMLLLFICNTPIVRAQNTIWQVQAIDTMKYSRDEARNADVRDEIDRLVEIVAGTGATHISIATPYNDEFIPVLTAWVQSARRHHLHVWFRGNFAEWEGWFGYAKFSDIRTHHEKTAAFIQANPELFVAGDIFTPVPEAENGGLGDPRGSLSKAQQYNQFLIDSYTTCQKSFSRIGKEVTCGYFSMNADVAKDVLTPDTVKRTGNVVVVDHYVRDPAQFEKDITFLSDKFHAGIVLGEFGAPIPDLNGNMTEKEQATYIQKLMEIMYRNKDRVIGMNYWTLINGSTSLLNENGTPREAVTTLTGYFKPAKIHGKVIDPFGDPVSDVLVQAPNIPASTRTDHTGEYTLLVPAGKADLEISKNGYHSVFLTMEEASGQTVTINEKLSLEQTGMLYYLRMIPVWIKQKIWGEK